MVFIFERRNGKRYYSKNLKDLCRQVRSYDGWFVTNAEKEIPALKKVALNVWADIKYIDRSQDAR